MEFWRSGGSKPATTVTDAQACEADGWDGQMFMDSQSLARDPYVLMGQWATATQRIKLSTGVTNPLTRHPAVTAASIATVQDISGGRAVLGLGRGDSALAYLGHAPVGIAAFERALKDLQALLSGQEVAFGSGGALDAPGLETLSLGDRPTTMRLRWLGGAPKVPLDVAATGPKVIEMGARIAERVTFSVGAVPERIDWAMGLAKAARKAAGLPEAGVSYGAQIIVSCHSNPATALAQATVMAAPLARFQVIQGAAAGPLSDVDAANLSAVRARYDMTKHGDIFERKKLLGAVLTAEFVDRFTVSGTPEQCYAKLVALAGRGMERLVLVGPSFYPPEWEEDARLFEREVLPALKRTLG